MTRLVATLVNHGTVEHALACARSLRREWSRAGYAPEDLELVVVDHPGRRDQEPGLSRLEAEGARVVRARENGGYAAGVERALAESAQLAGPADPRDVVAVLNPDLVFLPGSVEALVEHVLADPACGLAAPRTFLDEGCTFQLPMPPLPTARREVLAHLAGLRPRVAARVAAARARADWRPWCATEPQDLEMLSGACLFLRRALLDAGEPLLDERYPLYYEDADLCRRVRRRGLGLHLLPDAHVLHHGARSSGAGADFEGDPRARWRVARRAYLCRWAGPLGRAAVALADRLVARAPGRWCERPPHAVQPLPLAAGPATLPLPPRGPWLVELALSPTFGFCVGSVAPGGDWTLPRSAWDWLFEGRYWARALDPRDRGVVGAWTFAKHGPPAARPLLEWDEALEHAARAGWDAQRRRLDVVRERTGERAA